jgi:hypothetical protein
MQPDDPCKRLAQQGIEIGRDIVSRVQDPIALLSHPDAAA